MDFDGRIERGIEIVRVPNFFEPRPCLPLEQPLKEPKSDLPGGFDHPAHSNAPANDLRLGLGRFLDHHDGAEPLRQAVRNDAAEIAARGQQDDARGRIDGGRGGRIG